MTIFDALLHKIMEAPTAFAAADQQLCPKCKQHKLTSDGWPDEFYDTGKFVCTETFTCPNCGYQLRISDTYKLDPTCRTISEKRED